MIGGAVGDSSYNAQLAGVIGQNAVENNTYFQDQAILKVNNKEFLFKALEKNTLDRIGQLRDQGKYPEAYKLIYDAIKNDNAVPDDVKYWFKQAIEINANNNSVVNDFIRTMTRLGLEYDGKKVNSKQLQNTSNIIAENVLRDIFEGKGVPSLSQLLSKDIEAALRSNGQTMAGWAGSAYYWNLEIATGENRGKTVGEVISSDKKEMIKHVTIYDQTLSELSKRWGTLDLLYQGIPTLLRRSTITRGIDKVAVIDGKP